MFSPTLLSGMVGSEIELLCVSGIDTVATLVLACVWVLLVAPSIGGEVLSNCESIRSSSLGLLIRARLELRPDSLRGLGCNSPSVTRGWESGTPVLGLKTSQLRWVLCVVGYI